MKDESPRKQGAPRPGDGRTPLSPGRILDAALELADAHGLEKLSVRKLATALGVTPMAVYNHFDNKQAILVGLLDHLVSTYEPTAHEQGDPVEWLLHTFGIVREAMVDHPSLVPLMDAWLTLGPGSVSMEMMEACLETLASAGLDDRSAVRAFYAMVSFTVGFCTMEAATEVHRATLGDREEGLRRYQLVFEAAAMDRYPTIIRLAPELATAFEGDAFGQELRRIVEGALSARRSER